VAGLVIAVFFLVVALFAYLITPGDPMRQDLSQRLAHPGSAHWFGTDELGRDIFSRLVTGARTTFMVVAAVTAVVPAVGLVVGCIAGYCGGWVDATLTRLTDVFLALPRLILALALVAALGPGLDHAVVALALAAWPPYARLARAESLSIRKRDFIAAARLAGAPAARIIFWHIAPLCLPSLIVRASLDVSGTILAIAGLGFLGLGAPPGTPEWGAMVAAGRPYIFDQWWICLAPGVAIAVVSLGFNCLGDGLRDLLDPRRT
jgi:peptide/nickel transport system permease protein